MHRLHRRGPAEVTPIDGEVTRQLGLKILFPIHCTGGWVSQICLSLAAAMRDRGLDLSMWVPSAEDTGHRSFIREAAPRPVQRLLYRFNRSGWLMRLVERRFLASLRPGDIAYIWPGTSVDLLRRVKERGHTLVVERINCQEATAKPILDEAYRRLGLPANPTITDEDVRVAREVVALADRLFSPSPWVTRSLLDDGVPPDRIFESSYGWDPDRLRGTHRALPPCEGITALFVGTICVRKGAHLLLDAWARSGVRGRLLLAGRLEPLIVDRCAGHLDRPDIIHLGHVQDIGAIYRSADVFVLPTLEEGSPLVLCEAMGSGLPSVSSPMGVGAIARDGQEAIVLDPYDVDAWATTFRRLAADETCRRELGSRARRRAEEFTWAKVGARRLAQLAQAYSGSRSCCTHDRAESLGSSKSHVP